MLNRYKTNLKCVTATELTSVMEWKAGGESRNYVPDLILFRFFPLLSN